MSDFRAASGSYKMKFSFAFSLALTGFFDNFLKGKARSFNFDVG